MKILVFSDSHSNIKNMEIALEKFSNINDVIHLGDYMSDIKKIELKYPHLNINYVAGNNDFCQEEEEKILFFKNYKFFITHGHRYSVYYGISNIYYKMLENNANVLLFGHTHCKFLEKTDEFLILNPGSISNPRDCDVPSFAIIEIEEEKIFAKFYGIIKNKIIEF